MKMIHFFIFRFSKLYILKKNYAKFIGANIPEVKFGVLFTYCNFYENWQFTCPGISAQMNVL